MKIHHWKMSETLKRYSTGDIIILAEDADAARAKATEEFEAYLRREDGPLGVYWTSDGQFLTEMDEERYSELLAALAVDLAKEPSADEEAIFILWSE